MSEKTTENTAWAGDLFERKKVASAFEALSKQARPDDVFLVHSGFGTGKTFFVKNWVADLRRRKDHPVITFDAWKYDYFDSPIAAFISCLNDQIAEAAPASEVADLRAKLAGFGRRAAPIALKAGARIVTRALTMGVGDVDGISKILTDEMNVASADVSEEVAQAFSAAKSQKALRDSLHQSFGEVLKGFAKGHGSSPVLILIDELDRCRPEFALSLLEDIKHFLNDEGVVFFVFCDEEVLHALAGQIFGDKPAGEKYLKKFFSVRLRLPEPALADFIRTTCETVFGGESSGDQFAGELVHATTNANLSARQIDHVIRAGYIACTWDTIIRDNIRIAVWLLVIREGDVRAFQDLIEGRRLPQRATDLFVISDSGALKFALAVRQLLLREGHELIAELLETHRSFNGPVDVAEARLVEKLDAATPHAIQTVQQLITWFAKRVEFAGSLA